LRARKQQLGHARKLEEEPVKRADHVRRRFPERAANLDGVGDRQDHCTLEALRKRRERAVADRGAPVLRDEKARLSVSEGFDQTFHVERERRAIVVAARGNLGRR
jgi:hypothetical protein